MSSLPTSILIFAGSTRINSFNRKLAKEAARLVREAGARPTLIELSELSIPLYNADLELRGTPRDVIALKETLHSHPGWIIASPEYNGSYTALLRRMQPRASRALEKRHQALRRQSRRPAVRLAGHDGRPA
jgi:NAD(P)H-dependent FMN reductase